MTLSRFLHTAEQPPIWLIFFLALVPKISPALPKIYMYTQRVLPSCATGRCGFLAPHTRREGLVASRRRHEATGLMQTAGRPLGPRARRAAASWPRATCLKASWPQIKCTTDFWPRESGTVAAWLRAKRSMALLASKQSGDALLGLPKLMRRPHWPREDQEAASMASLEGLRRPHWHRRDWEIAFETSFETARRPHWPLAK